jgi:hypothetical protein
VALAVALSVVFVTPGVAQANVSQGVRELFYVSGSGYFDWRASDRFLHVRSGPQGLGANQCTDSIFDWTRSMGHYDARTVRSCRSYAWHSTEFYESSGLGLQGMQKAGYCYGSYNYSGGSSTSCSS